MDASTIIASLPVVRRFPWWAFARKAKEAFMAMEALHAAIEGRSRNIEHAVRGVNFRIADAREAAYDVSNDRLHRHALLICEKMQAHIARVDPSTADGFDPWACARDIGAVPRWMLLGQWFRAAGRRGEARARQRQLAKVTAC